ncbi:MAG TPA: gluconate 2-dehydrogenase subunit 3 family protein [Bryobacteraceae bacterium]|jgi:gluconate 2-dehydrogenase gamma chain|nr:gluconate 2-dehydrogenase subunit 3 family protein [Bryobacteraceae bacterium]
MKRREFLTIPATALGGTLLYTLAREPLRLQAQEGNVNIPLKFFSADEARLIAAACARIFPTDDKGPGANEAGVVIYIDRQLAGPYGRDKYRYTKGPFVQSIPEHGYQGKETPREVYRSGIAMLTGFADVKPEVQDAKLHSIERTPFFQMLRTHTIEGMFCDPMHGGNAGLIGWQLIGFPGPRMSYREEIDKYHGMPYRPKPVSLQQVVGHPVHGWEEEKDS